MTTELAVRNGNGEAALATRENFEHAMRVAKMLSASALVPERYQGEKGIANCVIALELAGRIGASPLMVMQHLYIVHGTPSWSGQFLISAVNSCGRFSALRYESKGTPGQDDYAVRAWAIELATNSRLDGAWLTWSTVKKEGWLGKNGSKWQSMPEQMAMYRSAAWWARAYAPEICMGLRTVEETREVPPDDGGIDPNDILTGPPPAAPITQTEPPKATSPLDAAVPMEAPKAKGEHPDDLKERLAETVARLGKSWGKEKAESALDLLCPKGSKAAAIRFFLGRAENWNGQPPADPCPGVTPSHVRPNERDEWLAVWRIAMGIREGST